MIKLCLVPGVGFADAVVARVGIFSMLAAGSGAGRPRVLSGLGRDIVGGGRQRRRRLIKLCLVPSVGFADAVVARVGIFSMLADGSSAGRARSLSSSLRRTIVGSARQRWRRLIRVHLVPGVGFANAVVARVGIFSMLADGSSAGRPRVLSSLRRDYRWRRSPAQETNDQSVSCSRRGICQCRRGQNWNLFHGRRRERRRAAPVLSSLRRTIVGGARQRRGRMIRVYLVPGVGFANAVVARFGIFSMVGGESGAGRPPVLSSLRRTIVGGVGSAGDE